MLGYGTKVTAEPHFELYYELRFASLVTVC